MSTESICIITFGDIKIYFVIDVKLSHMIYKIVYTNYSIYDESYNNRYINFDDVLIDIISDEEKVKAFRKIANDLFFVVTDNFWSTNEIDKDLNIFSEKLERGLVEVVFYNNNKNFQYPVDEKNIVVSSSKYNFPPLEIETEISMQQDSEKKIIPKTKYYEDIFELFNIFYQCRQYEKEIKNFDENIQDLHSRSKENCQKLISCVENDYILSFPKDLINVICSYFDINWLFK